MNTSNKTNSIVLRRRVPVVDNYNSDPKTVFLGFDGTGGNDGFQGSFWAKPLITRGDVVSKIYEEREFDYKYYYPGPGSGEGKGFNVFKELKGIWDGKSGEYGINKNMNTALSDLKRRTEYGQKINVKIVGWSRGAFIGYLLLKKILRDKKLMANCNEIRFCPIDAMIINYLEGYKYDLSSLCGSHNKIFILPIYSHNGEMWGNCTNMPTVYSPIDNFIDGYKCSFVLPGSHAGLVDPKEKIGALIKEMICKFFDVTSHPDQPQLLYRNFLQSISQLDVQGKNITMYLEKSVRDWFRPKLFVNPYKGLIRSDEQDYSSYCCGLFARRSSKNSENFIAKEQESIELSF